MLQLLHNAHGISLRDLFPAAQFLGAADIRVASCSADSRACLPGDLFVALPGAEQDGHDFVAQAIARGARTILAERPLPFPIPSCIVPDSRAAYGVLCQSLAGNPSRRLKVIGVTGTNGKTTTTYLIASILAAAGHRVGTLGTLGYWDTQEFEPGQLTTPAPPALASWLARMEANGCSHAVMEVSSHALSQSRVAGMEFDAACVTNVRHDHLDYHGSLANYRRAKARLFEHLSPEAFVVVNVDDAGAADYVNVLDCPVLTVAHDAPAELNATLIERFQSEQTFLLTAGSDTMPVRTQMIGKHHVSNCLVAAAVGLGYGVDLPTVVRGLEALGHVPGRLERIECGQPFAAYVDYAHTPDALAVSLDTLREVTAGRLICVFGAGGNRDRTKRPLMGRAVEERAELAIITADNPRDEDPGRIAMDILSGFERPRAARLVADRRQAIQSALSLAEPGDTVLIAGKGHEAYQHIGRQRYPFDDCEVVRSWLYRQNEPSLRFYAGDSKLSMAG